LIIECVSEGARESHESREMKMQNTGELFRVPNRSASVRLVVARKKSLAYTLVFPLAFNTQRQACATVAIASAGRVPANRARPHNKS
jgi:hypothetical protein